MLYDRWLQVVATREKDVALRDLTAGRDWTFNQLQEAADRSSAPSEPWVFPQGNDARFVIEVLRGWRHACTVCPLEPGQIRPGVPPPPPRLVHLKATSASTGAPRWVAFTAEQLAADPENIVATMGLRPDWPNLGVISLAHSYGFSNLVLPLLLHGIPLFLGPSALPEAVRRAAVGAGDHLTLAAVPALWRAWLEADAIPPNVRLAISAGAPLPVDLEHAVHTQRGLKIHNFYGSTECGGIAYDKRETPRTEAACAGQPMANLTLQIAGTGCLVVSGASVGETYWPEPSAELGRGQFQTCDLAELRADEVILRGRANDLINVAGRKVAPEAIEAVLCTHPQVRHCLVLGVPAVNKARGEAIVACVAGAAGLREEALREFLLGRLPAWQVPRRWWFVDHLEADARGKLSRTEWRRRYLEGSATTGC